MTDDALRTKVAVALHDAECGDRHCNGAALGAYYRQADIALAVAVPRIAEQATGAVCDWLVTEVSFPFDVRFGDKPPWLDLRDLAGAWHRHDPSETAETWLYAITTETGWNA